MSFDAGKSGNFEPTLMYNKEKDLIGIAEHKQLAAGKPKETRSSSTKATVSRHDVPRQQVPKARASSRKPAK